MTLVRLPGGTFFPYQVNTDQWILKNDGPTGPLSYLCYATKTSTKHGDQVWRSVVVKLGLCLPVDQVTFALWLYGF